MVQFPYEVLDGYVGPFYDQKVANLIVGQIFSTQAAAQTACTANAACKSIYFLQDNSGDGRQWSLSTDSKPQSLSGLEDPAVKVYKVYLKY